MPYINSDDKPSFLPPSRGLGKDFFNPKGTPQDPVPSPGENHGQQKSMSRYQFNRSLDRDPKIRQDLAKGLQKPLYSKEVNEAIEEIKAKLPQNLGGIIDENELRSLGSTKKQVERYWEEKHELRELSKDGLTAEEVKKLHRDEFKTKYFEHLLDLHKDKKE